MAAPSNRASVTVSRSAQMSTTDGARRSGAVRFRALRARALRPMFILLRDTDEREHSAGLKMARSTSRLTTQGSGVRGHRASLSSGRKHGRPASPATDCQAAAQIDTTARTGKGRCCCGRASRLAMALQCDAMPLSCISNESPPRNRVFPGARIPGRVDCASHRHR